MPGQILLRRTERGLAKAGRWRAGSRVGIGALGALGALETTVSLFDTPAPSIWLVVLSAVLGGVGGVASLLPPSKVSGRMGTTKVDIFVGDIFERRDHLAIAVNEYFDAELGDRVAPGSLHGQVLSRFFSGDTQRFRAAIEASLDGTEQDDHPPYPIGTTAVLDMEGRRLFLTAVAHTDPDTSQASADVDDLWRALSALWGEVRRRANGQSISIPLWGGGLGRVPIEHAGLLEVLLLSIERASRESPVTIGGVSIVLHDDDEEIDLSGLRLG